MRLSVPLLLMTTMLGLTACQSLTPEERRAADEQRCLGYGFKPATDGFATCLQRIDLDRREQSRADSAELMWQMSHDLNGPVYIGHWHHRH